MDYTPILISLKTASAAIVFTFFIGIFAAWGVISIKNQYLKAVLDGLFILPLVLPPTVAGFFLLYLLGVKRPIGHLLVELFGIRIPFSWSATVVAAVLLSFPLMYRSARGAFEQVNENTIYAARTLGMSEWNIFWRVRVAAALPGVASGGILAFARGLGEFGATAMIAGNIAGQTRTLPLAVYSAVAAGNESLAAKYIPLILIIAFLCIFGMNFFLGKGLRR